MGGIAITIAVLLAATFGIFLLIFVLVPLIKAVVWVVGHVLSFIGREVGDLVRIVGAMVTALVFVPLVLVNIVIGRWSAAAHYGRAIQGEIVTVGAAAYRVVIGHPARLLCLTSLTEGLEQRLPEAVAAAPGSDRPAGRAGQFPGYRIVGSLPGGGSGGRLYIAEPDDLKRAAFERQGIYDVDRVVIKSFTLGEGTRLPQIVRESRALEAARRLGLVLDHAMSDQRFYYVMRYVPGEPLSLVTPRLHAQAGGEGLDTPRLRAALTYAADLLRTLHTYHAAGLWHKDVKPDNIIVDGQRAHLVDFGLLTPLRSALTLTTHGTEYFRDPELVRLALKGVKVSEVDGARFDIYGVGAVLYSVVENSFPAHGGMSRISRRCPEALRWIIRRAMSDYDKRYPSAMAMLPDVQAVLEAPDPFSLRPADLPSVQGREVPAPDPVHVDEPVELPRVPAGPLPAPEGTDGPGARPRIRIRNWFTGAYAVEGGARVPLIRPALTPLPPRGHPLGLSAQEQLRRARARAAAARQRALTRRHGPSRRSASAFDAGVNWGVAVALLVLLVGAGLVVGGVFLAGSAAPDGSPRVAIGPGEAAIDLPVVSVGEAAAPDPAQPASQRRRGRLVVLYRPTSFSSEGLAIVQQQLARVRAQGYDLIGADLELPEPDAETVASLWKAVGQAQPMTDAARAAIRGWLAQADAGDPCDGVVWIDRPDPDAPARAWVVHGGTLAAEDVAGIVGALGEFPVTGATPRRDGRASQPHDPSRSHGALAQAREADRGPRRRR